MVEHDGAYVHEVRLRWAVVTFCILLIVRTPMCGFTQPDTLWTRTYGGSHWDEGYSIAQTADGGYILVGSTKSYGIGGSDIYLIKVSADGDLVWTKMYGGIRNDYGYSVIQTTDGGFVVTGVTHSYGQGGADIYVVRTDFNGDSLWARTYGGTDDECGWSVIQATDGNYIVAGYTDSYGSGWSDVYLIEIDSNGDSLWAQAYGGASDDEGYSITRTSDGGYVVVGMSWSDLSGYDVYLIRSDSTGDTLWTKTYGGDGDDVGMSVAEMGDAGCIVTGYTTSYGAGSADVWVIRTDADGDTLWTKTYGGSEYDWSYAVGPAPDGGCIVVGETYSFGAGRWDVYAIRTDADGDTLWTRAYGGPNWDGGRAVVTKAYQWKYVIAGYTYSYGTGGSDVYLIPLVESQVALSIDPAQTWVPRGGTLDFRVTYDNRTAETRSVEVIFEAYTPGATDPVRTFYNTLSFDPGSSVKHYALLVPSFAPLGPGYILTVKIIDPPGSAEAIAQKNFGFEVKPGMESISDDTAFIKTVIPQSAGPDTFWTRTYGGSEAECGYSIIQSHDGGYVIAGSTTSYGSGGDLYLVKTDSKGDSLWAVNYGAFYAEIGRSIVQTSDGGYIVTGSSWWGSSGRDIYLVRTDPGGERLWTKTYGGPFSDVGYSVVQAADGGYLVAGNTWSYGDGRSDVYLIRTDHDGDTLWTRTYGDFDYDDAFAVLRVFNDCYVVAGRTCSYGDGDSDVYLMKIDSEGDTLWTRTYGGPLDDEAYAIAQTSDNGYLVAGWSSSYTEGDVDVFVIRTDANGDTVWTRTYGGVGVDIGWSVAQAHDGGSLVVGYTESSGAGGSDIFVVRIGSTGDTLWTTTYGGSDDDEGYSVVRSVDGGYVVAGLTESYGAGASDVYLLRLRGGPVTLFPDPAQQWVPQRGTLDFSVVYRNWTPGIYTVEAVFYGYLPGAINPAKSFLNKYILNPGLTTKYYALAVPGVAPVDSGYRLVAKIIDQSGSGDAISEDSFVFEVTPGMESVPLE
jgi:hypothetical protein